MRNRILIVILVLTMTLLSVASAATPADKQKYFNLYENKLAQSLRYTMTMMMDGELLSVAEVWMKGEKLYSDSQAGGIRSYAINDGKHLYLWTSGSPYGQRIGLNVSSPGRSLTADDINSERVDVTILGQETVNGYSCLKAEVKMEGQVQYHWVSYEFGVAVRVLAEGMQMDVTNILPVQIPDSTFIPPINVSFSESLPIGFGQVIQKAYEQAATEAHAALSENLPVNKAGFLAIMAKRGSIPAIYTEVYDNALKTKVSVSVKGNKEYRFADGLVKLYMMYDGQDIYAWNSMVKTVNKVKPGDVLLQVLAPYDPTIAYAKDFASYEYIGREQIAGEMCRGALVLYNGRPYEVWVSEKYGMIMSLSSQNLRMDVNSVYEKDVPDSSFQLPSGYKVK